MGVVAVCRDNPASLPFEGFRLPYGSGVGGNLGCTPSPSAQARVKPGAATAVLGEEVVLLVQVINDCHGIPLV